MAPSPPIWYMVGISEFQTRGPYYAWMSKARVQSPPRHSTPLHSTPPNSVHPTSPCSTIIEGRGEATQTKMAFQSWGGTLRCGSQARAILKATRALCACFFFCTSEIQYAEAVTCIEGPEAAHEGGQSRTRRAELGGGLVPRCRNLYDQLQARIPCEA